MTSLEKALILSSPVKWKEQCFQRRLVSPALPGLAEVMVIHTWFTSKIFQHTLGAPNLELQATNGSEEARRMQR